MYKMHLPTRAGGGWPSWAAGWRCGGTVRGGARHVRKLHHARLHAPRPRLPPILTLLCRQSGSGDCRPVSDDWQGIDSSYLYLLSKALIYFQVWLIWIWRFYPLWNITYRSEWLTPVQPLLWSCSSLLQLWNCTIGWQPQVIRELVVFNFPPLKVRYWDLQ